MLIRQHVTGMNTQVALFDETFDRSMVLFISVLTSSTYLFTAGVEVVDFHLITLRHTPQSVGLRWTRDRPVTETCTWQHKHSLETNMHASGGIRTHDPSKRSAADLRHRPRGHWDRPWCCSYVAWIFFCSYAFASGCPSLLNVCIAREA
jgi:hypothetical protein